MIYICFDTFLLTLEKFWYNLKELMEEDA